MEYKKLDFSYEISKTTDVEKRVNEIFENLGNIYSYIIFDKDDTYLLKFTIYADDKYNTFNSKYVCYNILSKIKKSQNCETKVYFEQPNINIIYELYNNFLKKIAMKTSKHWNMDFDDCYQIACLVLVKLYNKGYYLNKNIITTSFDNEILCLQRKNKTDVIIISIDDSLKTDEGNLTIKDTIEDTQDIIDKETKEQQEYAKIVLNEIKFLLRNNISDRRFDFLLRRYATKTVDGSSAKDVQFIKKKLKDMNITKKYFDKYL